MKLTKIEVVVVSLLSSSFSITLYTCYLSYSEEETIDQQTYLQVATVRRK